MTEPIDAATLHARRHLFSMMARGMDGDSICADMEKIGWSKDRVLSAVHAVLEGTINGPNLTPTERAKIILAGTAEEAPDVPGGWRLRGAASSPAAVIRAANVALKNFSMPLLKYPGVAS